MRTSAIKTQAFLARVPLFQEMTDEELGRLAIGTTEHRVTKGQVIFQRGDPCVGFHIVVYGQIKLAFTSPQGSEKVVEIIGPGMSFGEALMFTDRPYIVYAQALADSMLLHIAKETIDGELRRDPALARRMLAGLSRRLHALIQDVEAYSLRSGMQRVIGYLLRDVDASPADDRSVRIRLEVGKGVIASRLNLTPEHFSRILNELSGEHVIEVHGAEIDILDVERMRQLSR